YCAGRLHPLPIPMAFVNETLDRTGFLTTGKGNIARRFMDFYPRDLLDGLEIPGLKSSTGFHRFAFCLKEKTLDAWLAATARRSRWPLDFKRHPRTGRPALSHLIRPILQDAIASGRWRQGIPLKSLVHLIRSKIEGPKIDRETVKRVMNDLFKETGNIAYRYVQRSRRLSNKPRRLA